MKRFIKCMSLACVFALVLTLAPVLKSSMGFGGNDVQVYAATKSYETGVVKKNTRTKIAGKYFWMNKDSMLCYAETKDGEGIELGDYYYSGRTDIKNRIVTNGDRVFYPSTAHKDAMKAFEGCIASVKLNQTNRKIIHTAKYVPGVGGYGGGANMASAILSNYKGKIYFYDYSCAGAEESIRFFCYNTNTGKLKLITKNIRPSVTKNGPYSLGGSRYLYFKVLDPKTDTYHHYIYDCKTDKRIESAYKPYRLGEDRYFSYGVYDSSSKTTKHYIYDGKTGKKYKIKEKATKNNYRRYILGFE